MTPEIMFAVFVLILWIGYFGLTSMVRWLAIGAGFVFAHWLLNSTVTRVAIVGTGAYAVTYGGMGL